ncbi:MAG: ankyrin repeat domain-containing protein [Desulfovibrio sp.]|nr:ankyrin repeat domain-containing protein [Desulfovibrio sp.]
MARAQGFMAGWAGRAGRVLALALLLALGVAPGDVATSRAARAHQTPPVPQLPRVRHIPQPPAQKPSAVKPFVAKPSGEELLLFRLESRLLERLGQGWGIDDRDLQGYTLLERCCADKAFDSEAMVALFVRHHANLSTQSAIGLTPLNYAIASSSQHTVEALVAAGADVNACDYEETTVLMQAAGLGEAGMVAALLRRGADPNAANLRGFTPLLYAVHPTDAGEDQATCVRLLVEAGAEPDRSNVSGFTPLMNAAFLGERDTVRQLLEHGANPALENVDGANALHLAASGCQAGTLEMLLDAGLPADRDVFAILDGQGCRTRMAASPVWRRLEAERAKLAPEHSSARGAR